jgi:3-(3-hydroxy-phenyl)propionate hydroxylase
VRVGTVFPRRLALDCGISGSDVDPLAWTLAVLPPAENAGWPHDPWWLAARHPRLRVVRLPLAQWAELKCLRPGYYLVRPDGHIAAHGHERDLDRLRAELDLALTPAVPVAG